MAGARVAWEYDQEFQLFWHFIPTNVLVRIGHASRWDWIEYPNYLKQRLYFPVSFQIIKLVDAILLVVLQADLRKYEYEQADNEDNLSIIGHGSKTSSDHKDSDLE
jgi:hypothetical protein